jgi:hypothetical protein
MHRQRSSRRLSSRSWRGVDAQCYNKYSAHIVGPSLTLPKLEMWASWLLHGRRGQSLGAVQDAQSYDLGGGATGQARRRIFPTL